MTDILPPITGKQVDKILGKDAVAIVTDEVLIGLIPTRINGVDNCIAIKIADSQGCCDVFPEMPKRHVMQLVQEIGEDGPDFIYITMPMCHRTRAKAWGVAADIFEALGKTCRGQAMLANSMPSGSPPSIPGIDGKEGER